MNTSIDTTALEREAYRSYWSDGIVDIYLGLSLLFMGAMWTWINDVSALAGVLPAVLVTPMLAGHKRFVEARLGRVEWRPARRGWERRNLWLALVAGIGVLVLAVAASGAVAGADGISGEAGILAWLLALLALGLAFVMDVRRFVLYAAVLAIGGFIAGLLDTEPGWPMLVCGIVATGVGVVMLRRFVERHPIIEPS